MAVTMNSVGNYSAYALSSAKNNRANVKSVSEIQPENINSEEKKFFADMYPANRTEIMEYYYYEKSGRMNGISLGTNLDRRG